MGYFPFFAEIENSRWLIVGGGAVAFRKAGELLPFGVRIRVVSSEINPSFNKLKEDGPWKERLMLEERDFKEEDLANTQFVIAATSCPQLNQRIARLCRSKGIPVNAADGKKECSFLFPSLIKAGAVTIGISTEGTSPALARCLRKHLSAALPQGLEDLAEQLGGIREQIKEAFPYSPKARSALFSQLAEAGLNNGRVLTEKMIREIIERKLEEDHE